MNGYQPIELNFRLTDEDLRKADEIFVQEMQRCMMRTAAHAVKQIERAAQDIRTCAAVPGEKPDPLRGLIENVLRHYEPPKTHSCVVEFLK